MLYQEEKGKRRTVNRETPDPWVKRKGRGGRKKRFSTVVYFCSNPSCDYYRITDDRCLHWQVVESITLDGH
jgi:hypothetical protein